MKKPSTSVIHKLIITFCFILLSVKGFSQGHVKFSLKNVTSTSRTIEFDIFIVNDGTDPAFADLLLRNVSLEINYDDAILNGGTPEEGTNVSSFIYQQGSQSPDFSGITDRSQALFPFSLNHNMSQRTLKLTQTPVKSPQNSSLRVSNVEKRLGRFTFTNTTCWTPGSQPKFAFYVKSPAVPGHTPLLAKVIENQTFSQDYDIGSGRVSVDLTGSAITLNVQDIGNPCKTIASGTVADLTDVLSSLNAYPNPTTGKAAITFNSDRAAKYTLKMVDIIGKVMMIESISAVEGYNEKAINLESTAKGIYILTIDFEGMEAGKLKIVVE
jgi:hypothetical protein